MSERNQFGTFGGVFTPCILTILGVILFMRADFVIGQAGIAETLAILLVATSITLLTALSTGAIGTNMRVRGGGAYFLISRVLGVEYGGAIGLMLFLALAVSVPFYVLGFTEALVQSFPALEAHDTAIAFGTAAVLFVLTYVGAGWAIRTQYLIMAVLFASVAVFLGGAWLRFSPETFSANWSSAYTALQGDQPEAESYSFWVVFAIYFPAVTGILAGINMSGDLKDPGKSIPRGTLMAIAVGGAVYLAQIVVCGGAFTRADLVARPFLSLRENALYGMGWLVAAGVFAATLSSALGSFMGAPRVLQALARDGIVPVLQPFASGTRKGDEPRRALVAAGVLTVLVLVWANTAPEGQAFNLVAETITEFFLCTYGMLNLAAFVEGVGRNPSFRPRFKYFHWSTALAGALGCVAVAFVINPVEAAIAMVLLGGLVWYIKRRELRTSFGDAWRGFLYKNIRNDLMRLSEMPENPKNWRPTCLVFSGYPESRLDLVNYGVWFEADRGLVFLVQVLVGSFEDYGPRRAAAFERLEEFCRENDLAAFPVVVIDETLERGMAGVMQALSVGPIRPNLALFGWVKSVAEEGRPSPASFRMAQTLGMAVCVLRPGDQPLSPIRTRIDIWWRGRKNGGLMLLLAHLLQSNWAWRDAEIRLLRVIDNEAGREGTLTDLQQLSRDARVEVKPTVLVAQQPFEGVLHRESEKADLVILGFEMPEAEADAAWHARYDKWMYDGPTILLVCSAGSEDILA